MIRDARIDRRRHILHVIPLLDYGGAQELLVLMAKWSPKNRYRTTICVLLPNPELKAKAESYGAEVICFNRPRPSILKLHRFISYFYRNVRDIVSLCRREHVDVIHCHLSEAEFVGIVAGFWTSVDRILTTLHAPEMLPARSRRDPRNFLRWLATRILYKWVYAVIAVSEDTAAKVRDFAGVNPDKVFTIVNGIDVDSFQRTQPNRDLATKLGLSAGDKVILTVARLSAGKGHVYLIEAVGRLMKRYPAIRLLLAGDGDLREQLKAKCSSLGVSDHVHFLGNRPDVADLLALADIFVFPSLGEGTPLALLEAMAAEKPIVATDIPANRSLLLSPKCGLLVPAADGQALAEAISYLLEHPKTASEYGQIARRVARDRFDVRQNIAQLEKLWGRQVALA